MKYSDFVAENGFWTETGKSNMKTLMSAFNIVMSNFDELSEQQLNVLQSLILKDISDSFSPLKEEARHMMYDESGRLIHRASLKEGGFIKLGNENE